MLPRQRLAALLAAVLGIVCVVAAALPARSAASSTQQTILMDDNQLIYSSPSHVLSVLQTLHGLGVDRVKVSVVWSLIAPNPMSRHRPRFNATNPAAYPAGRWDRYDLIDTEATALGMSVYFQLDPPSPVWGIPAHQPKQGPKLGLAPDMRLYRQFVEAIGRRYSGSYAVRTTTTTTTNDPLLPGSNGVPLPVGAGSSQQHTSTTERLLPRVNFWGIWNEPNERSWLSPTRQRLGRHDYVRMQPYLYRSLVDASYAGLRASGHADDTIVVGETANRGVLTPAQFIRGVYCVSEHDTPLTGVAAQEYGCPTSGDPAYFVAHHPGLFRTSGFAHHPYSLDVAPQRRYPNPTFYTLANASSFERFLNGVLGAYETLPRGGVPLYLTEFGYKTNPPNPYAKVSLAAQAAYLDEADYMAYEHPYIKVFSQFLLVDDVPKATEAEGSIQYWSTFQTGLETQNGAAKPAFDAFRLPVWLPSQRAGSSVTVWGQLRPADHSQDQYGVLEFEPRGSNSWVGLSEVQTANPEGYFVSHVSIPGAGRLRLVWLAPDGSVYYSRTVRIAA